MRAILILTAALVVLAPGDGAYAQIPACGEAVEPSCDGFCTTPGEFCTGLAGACGCAPSGGTGCGIIVGPPMCLGDCPPFEACFSVAGVCECRGALLTAVPSLPRMGLILFGALLLATSLFLLQRRLRSRI